jgi:hypothetical protein
MAVTEELLSALVPAARIALPFIESMVAEGASTAAIQAGLEQLGQTFRRTDFLAVVRAARDVELSRDYLKSVPKKFLPNPARLPPPITRTLRAFSMRVTITGRGGVTGSRAMQTLTISSSANISRQEAIDKAIELFLAQQQLYRPDQEAIEPDTIEADTGTATYLPPGG